MGQLDNPALTFLPPAVARLAPGGEWEFRGSREPDCHELDSENILNNISKDAEVDTLSIGGSALLQLLAPEGDPELVGKAAHSCSEGLQDISEELLCRLPAEKNLDFARCFKGLQDWYKGQGSLR